MATLEKFNPTAPFLVRKPMILAGSHLVLGDPFPKGAVAERRLRQLHSNRWIVQLAAETVQPKKEKKRG